MAEATTYHFSHQEVVEALIKQQDLHDGIWSLIVEFGLGSANTGPGPQDLNPTAIVPVLKMGLVKSKELTNLAVDASVVNPAKKASPAKKTAGPAKSK